MRVPRGKLADNRKVAWGDVEVARRGEGTGSVRFRVLVEPRVGPGACML